MTTRKLTVQEDEKGLFVKFRVFIGHWLIIRPGAPKCFGVNGFKKGNKVYVSYWNMNMGYFMVRPVGDMNVEDCIWRGPCWVNEDHRGEWVGEQIKFL